MDLRMAFYASVSVCIAVIACSTTQKQQTEAEGTYGANLVNCTTKSKTLAESRACEIQVKMTWINADMSNCAANGSSVAQIESCEAAVGIKWGFVDGGLPNAAGIQVLAAGDGGAK